MRTRAGARARGRGRSHARTHTRARPLAREKMCFSLFKTPEISKLIPAFRINGTNGMQSGVHGERAPRAPCRAPRAAHRASTGIRNALGRRVYSARARNTAREARALPQPRHAAFSALIPSLHISERSCEPLPAKKAGGKRTDLAGTGGGWRKGNCKLRIANCKLRIADLQPPAGCDLFRVQKLGRRPCASRSRSSEFAA